jgi:uncharacterized membrane protein
VETPGGSVVRAFFTVLGLAVVSLPVVGWLSSAHSVRWGTAPEWIAALSLVVIAAGVWRLARDRERSAHDRELRR